MLTKRSLASVALFFSGLFAGGVLDHGLLALQSSEVTSYGINVGVTGNWAFMLMDGKIAVLLFLVYRRFNVAAAA